MTQPYIRVLAGLAAVAIALAGVVGLGTLATFYYLAPTLPEVATLRDVRLQVPLRVYARDGRLLAQIGEQRRIPVRFEDVPEPLVQAFLAAEDDRFFEHGGIDLAGLSRAVLTAGERGGGSTITMQLARNMFLTPEKQIRRKLREIFLALRIEAEFSKQEILTLYLNKIFLGQRAYGVAAAAETFFGKSLGELTLAEMATIAGLPKAPSQLNPIASAERAKQRRGYVLRRMADKGFVTAAEAEAADREPMPSQEFGPRVELDAPYVAEMVRAFVAEKYGEDVYTAGYRVVTTIDSRLQRAADWALRAALLEYDRRHGWRGPVARGDRPGALAATPAVGPLVPAVVVKVEEKSATVRTRAGRELTIPWETGLAWARRVDRLGNPGAAPKRAADVLAVGDVVHVQPAGGDRAYLAQVPAVQGAFVALDPQDGAVAALTGGFDFYRSKFNRAVQARRQPGSAFKPFVYSAALEQGFTPASIILDAPVVLEGASEEETWRPENDSGRFYGPTRFRDALARSRNLVSIRILRAIGVDFAVDWASRFGFPPHDLPRNLTLALGTAQVTPLEMTAGFAVFANGGYRVPPYLVERVEDATGKVVYEAEPRVVCRECAAPGDTPAGDLAADGLVATASVEAAPAVEPSGAPTPGATRAAAVGVTPPDVDPKRLAPLAISPANAYVMTDLMRDVIRRGTAGRALQLQRTDLAGKTGTTNDNRDTWFVGYNAELVAGAWVGFDQERSLGDSEEGGRTALPMWVYFMREALAGRPPRALPQPPGVVTARVSLATGELVGPDDPDGFMELFLADRLPGAGAIAGDGAGVATAQQQTQPEDEIF